MVTLTRRNRSLCAIAGAIAASAGFGLIPLYAHSASAQIGRNTGGTLEAGTRSLLREREPRFELPSIDDPFARPLPAVPATSGRPPANHRARMDNGHLPVERLMLRAILTGPRAHVLLDDGTSTRILAAGDAVGATRVRSIDPGGVSLADGRRLTLPEMSP